MIPFVSAARCLILAALAVLATAALSGSFNRAWADSASADAVQELELPEINGARMLRLSAYVAQPLVLNFWSSDCPPCVAEMPLLEKASARHPNVQFIGIAVDSRLKAQQFLLTQQVNYVQAVAPLQSDGILRRFGNRKGVLPFTVVLDRTHRLCRSKSGGVDADWLDRTLRTCSEPPHA